MNINTKISLFKNYMNPKPCNELTMEEFCGSIIDSEYKNEIEAIRNEPDKKKRDNLKASLPAATISGTFSRRAKEDLVNHSGFIAIDFDAKENPTVNDWAALRDTIGGFENVLFAALSVSGFGIFVIMPLAYPHRHEQQFEAIVRDYAAIGLIVDQICCDVSRLRGISSDPSGVWNPHAIPYPFIYEPKKKMTVSNSYKNSKDDYEQLISKILGSGMDITNSYKNWFEIGCSIASECGEAGRNDFHQVSMSNPEYDAARCDKQFDNCLKHHYRFSKSTIFHYAKQYGIVLKTKSRVAN